MWKDYSLSFIKKNRASGISIVAAAFISALFLSLLCSLFYNFWIYEIENIIMEEGDWHGRIVGDMDENDLALIRNFANVEKAVINENESEMSSVVTDIYFKNPRTVFRDMPLITEKLGLEEDAAVYNTLLLSRYMIHDPRDKEPPLLMTFYLVILMIVSVSLILIIHNSFAVSMDARIHQLGIISGIGATPGQIRACLLQEAAMLCIAPILSGSLAGIALTFGTIRTINFFAEGMTGRHEAVFRYDPIVFAVTFLVSVLTVFISACIPAVRLSRLTPLQAIHNAGGLQLKKGRHSHILSMMFGIEGELAGNALKAQKKALRTSALSLTLSFLGFTIMLCFFTLSGISTDHTYFERYQNMWDVMVTVKDQQISDFALADELGELPGVKSCIVYQKAKTVVSVPEEEISREVNELGGPEMISGGAVTAENGYYLIQSPIVVMDDEGFAEYCRQLGVSPELDGCIVLNRIWDSINSNFRYREYVPFVTEDADIFDIPVTAYTQEVPVLREEYDDYALVQFIPLSLWNTISAKEEIAETDTYIRILAKDDTAPDGLGELETEISRILGKKYDIEIENRIQEKITNDNMIRGSMLILGGFCALLALIGIANVFSNTLGFLRQRKREFAQYMSVGMTPGGMRKMFCIEAAVIAGRPLLVTLPITALAVKLMITASYLDPAEFWEKAPIVPIIIFMLLIFGFVAFAYYIGGRRVLKYSLAEALRNDSMS